MTLLELAIAHLNTVHQTIEDLKRKRVDLEAEITRLTNILEEGSKLVNESNVDSATN